MILTPQKTLMQRYNAFVHRGLDNNFEIYGDNYEIGELHSILGLLQLKHLKSFISHRNKIASIYRQCLDNFSQVCYYQKVPANFEHSYWRFIVFLKNKKNLSSLVNFLKQHGIETLAPYTPAFLMHPYFKKQVLDCPVALELNGSYFSLPVHYKISISNAQYICKILSSFFERNCKQ